MGLMNVLAAAAASWLVGVIWYARSGRSLRLATAPDHRPTEGAKSLIGAPLLLLSAAVMVLVAGFMRHIFFVSGLTTGVSLGLVAGMGIGLFFIAPWMVLCNAAAGRPLKVAMIDGGFASIGCAVMGALLVAF